MRVSSEKLPRSHGQHPFYGRLNPMLELKQAGLRSYVAETNRGREYWKGQTDQQPAVYGNRWRIRGAREKRL